MKSNLKKQLDSLQLSDVYSLILFILYKIQDIPEYKTLSELCYLLDGNSIIRTLTYFEGQTIKIPTKEDMTVMSSALLIYQYTQTKNYSIAGALDKLNGLTDEQKEKAVDLYYKIIPIIDKYEIDKEQIRHGR